METILYQLGLLLLFGALYVILKIVYDWYTSTCPTCEQRALKEVWLHPPTPTEENPKPKKWRYYGCTNCETKYRKYHREIEALPEDQWAQEVAERKA
ncbi:MAG: hypothetical protein AAF485_23110 [Chloroflexota bacterium]